MPIPSFEEIKIPVLRMMSDGQPRRRTQILPPLADHFRLTDAEISELLPSGTESKWQNRVSWALYDLYKAGLLIRVKHGTYQISDLGKQVQATNPASLSRQELMKYPEFAKWVEVSAAGSRLHSKRDSDKSGHEDASTRATPEERISEAHAELQHGLISDVLDLLRNVDALRFEKIVLDVLLAMGYGGSREEAASLTKASHDEGIDGIINEDRLGLDVIYVQAKRWNDAATIGRKEIQSFVGALAGKQANKGIFITTSSFAGTAKDYVGQISQKVVLIDGTRFAELMIEHDIGVSTERAYKIKRIDSDYFDS